MFLPHVMKTNWGQWAWDWLNPTFCNLFRHPRSCLKPFEKQRPIRIWKKTLGKNNVPRARGCFVKLRFQEMRLEKLTKDGFQLFSGKSLTMLWLGSCVWMVAIPMRYSGSFLLSWISLKANPGKTWLHNILMALSQFQISQLGTVTRWIPKKYGGSGNMCKFLTKVTRWILRNMVDICGHRNCIK